MDAIFLDRDVRRAHGRSRARPQKNRPTDDPTFVIPHLSISVAREKRQQQEKKKNRTEKERKTELIAGYYSHAGKVLRKGSPGLIKNRR